MDKPSNIEKRLRFLRLAIVVIVILSFVISLIIPSVTTGYLPDEQQLGFIDTILRATVIALLTGLIGFMVYFAYSQTLLYTI